MVRCVDHPGGAHSMKRPSSLPLSLLLVALLGAGCASTPAAKKYTPVDTGNAFLWEVKDPRGGTAYLVGSIHMGKAGALTLPSSMESAFTKAHVLAVEVDTTRTDEAAMQKLVRELGTFPEGQSLSQRLDPSTRDLLSRAATRLGVQPQGLERLRPWLAGIVLNNLEFKAAGYEQGHGVDRAFLDRAHAAHKQVLELETAEAQFRMLSGTPDNLQDLMLRDQLRREQGPGEIVEALTSAWKAGDADGMAGLLLEGAKDTTYRPVYERVFFERNVQMASRLEALLTEPRVHLVVVGAGHVVGPEGIVALLQKKGHSVRQLPRETPID
ncbi:TraB/GumN family protein [Myxococcus sp. CA040A]|uniref:TraB/GumN family protein n=2 Tax=Myxococcaceae TaxID=31 RepID=A0A540WS85_9BACT|nr:TraB/GumN family protein [Myxococcus sp. CA040A]TQF11850.1 TraB/GumN family protein [Myxococcus llanfairpwllgwyngyllgogerychwyrndrobwllllantysiliogogogochensis]